MGPTDIDTIVDSHIDQRGPGVAVAVVMGTEVVHRKGYGLASLERDEAIEPETVFCLGSTTKPFTASAIMLLEQQGKLALDDPVTAHLPDYPKTGRNISIAHLLTHTSGIKNYVALDNFWDELSGRDLSPDALIALFQDLPLLFRPGARYSYSNSNYCLLGRIIERISGMSYGEFIGAHVFEPLRMRQSYYLGDDRNIPRRASGYDRGDRGYQPARYLSMTLPYAAGSLGSTVEDLIRWDAALWDGRWVDGSVQERMYTPVELTNGRTENYGLGWGLGEYRGHRVVHHAGGVPGFSAFVGRFLNDRVTIFILSNLGGFDAAGLARPIANVVLDLPAPRRMPRPLSASTVTKFAGTYVGDDGIVEVVADGNRLMMRGPVTGDLVPVSDTVFYVAEDEDVQVQFETGVTGNINRVTVMQPFYWFSATSLRGMNSGGEKQ
jgi:CubicO group peptidase (beta-lactamase class C family)